MNSWSLFGLEEIKREIDSNLLNTTGISSSYGIQQYFDWMLDLSIYKVFIYGDN